MAEDRGTSPSDAETLEGLRRKRRELWDEYRRLVIEADALDIRIRDIIFALTNLSMIAKEFGGDFPVPPIHGHYVSPASQRRAEAMRGRSSGIVTEGRADTPLPLRMSGAVPDPASFATMAAVAGAMGKLQQAVAHKQGAHPKVKNIVLDELRKAGARGSKAAPIRQILISIYGIETHEKTVGMTLYRLSREGLARRDGVTWFFVPPQAEKNPGGETPGPSNVP